MTWSSAASWRCVPGAEEEKAQSRMEHHVGCNAALKDTLSPVDEETHCPRFL